MKKYIAALAVVLILFVFPAISWYYLQSGYDYRLQSLDDLTPKDSLSTELFVLKGDTLKAADFFEGKTTIVMHNNHESVKNESVEVVLDQFENSYSFQFVHLVDDPLKYSTKVGEKELNTLFEIGNDFLTNHGKSAFSIVDQNMKVRGFYMGDDDGMRNLVEHIAIVLPRRPEKDIKLKRDLNQ